MGLKEIKDALIKKGYSPVSLDKKTETKAKKEPKPKPIPKPRHEAVEVIASPTVKEIPLPEAPKNVPEVEVEGPKCEDCGDAPEDCECEDCDCDN